MIYILWISKFCPLFSTFARIIGIHELPLPAILACGGLFPTPKKYSSKNEKNYPACCALLLHN